jgi:hypothetical protein
VRTVLIGGQPVVEDGVLTAFSEAEAVAEAAAQRTLLLARAGLTG